MATEPTELVVCDGDPSWAPVEGMDLLYVSNTDSQVFLDIESQYYYVLLSGRWYRGREVADALEWEHVPNGELPPGFGKIAEDSVNAGVLPFVAGTDAAREALLDNTVPQTAGVKRDAAGPAPEYDGTPEFVDVTDLPTVEYAVNTPAAVFRVGDRYWLCAEAVWYESASPTGPWSVATEVPAILYELPPSNPHYNVVYVKVYEVTPEVVYVGYTPGYVGSYCYHGCVVYGTGWYYRPWYGSVYYPRQWTWGLRVTYNPWTGWGFGITFSNGPFHFGIGWSGGYRWGGAWFGPAGYRPYPRPYVGVGFRKTEIDIDRNVNIGGDRPGTPRERASLYDRAGNRDRVAERPGTRERARPAPATGRANDVFTDRAGNVYRRGEGGAWQERAGGDWRSARDLDRSRPSPSSRPSTRPATPSTRPSSPSRRLPSTRPSTGGATRPQLERDFRSRQRGSARAGSFSRGGGGGFRRR